MPVFWPFGNGHTIDVPVRSHIPCYDSICGHENGVNARANEQESRREGEKRNMKKRHCQLSSERSLLKFRDGERAIWRYGSISSGHISLYFGYFPHSQTTPIFGFAAMKRKPRPREKGEKRTKQKTQILAKRGSMPEQWGGEKNKGSFQHARYSHPPGSRTISVYVSSGRRMARLGCM